MKHGTKILLLWAGFALAVAALVWFVRSGDPWKVSLTMAGGSQSITIERQSEVYYRITLPESSGANATYTLRPGAVHAPGWTEKFYDGTALPGRWTLTYGTHEIDLMPSSLLFNRKSHAKGSVIIQK